MNISSQQYDEDVNNELDMDNDLFSKFNKLDNLVSTSEEEDSKKKGNLIEEKKIFIKVSVQ